MNDSEKTFSFLRRKAREYAATTWSRKELAQVVLLKGAHQETIAPLLRDCPVKLLKSGEVLIPAGELCETLYVVLSGRLQMQDGSSVRVGDCFGELFLLRRALVSSTVAAAEPTRVLMVNRNTAWVLIRASHEIARNWLSLFADRSDATVTIGGNMEVKTSHGHLETHDERTGLHNRTWLESILPRQMARSVSNGTPLTLLLAEIDDFADYLVQFGTDAGNRLCRVMADALLKNIRPTDLSASYGRAQFAIVLPEADVVDACRVAEHVRQAMSRAASAVSTERDVSLLTVSVGVTQLQPPADAIVFLAAAEAALQMAKTSGGNRVGMRSSAA